MRFFAKLILSFLLLFAGMALGWTVVIAVANAQICGNMPIGPDREDCRLDKIGIDIRTSDLAGARARAELERLRSDINIMRDMAIDEPIIDVPVIDPPADPPSDDPVVDDPPADDTPDVTPPSAGIPDMGVKIDGAEITLSKELDPWIDGTRIFVSEMVDGFRLMAYVHPQHRRWVVQYSPKLGRVADGYEVLRHGPYVADILLDGAVLATYEMKGHAAAQEWSHEAGKRPFIRDVDDLVQAGLLPVHAPPTKMLRDTSQPKPQPIIRQILQPGVEPVDPYAPFDHGPLVPGMGATGDYQEAHWTRPLATLAAYGDRLSDAEKAVLLENVRVSAESFGVFAFGMEDKDSYRPVDMRKDYYAQSNDVGLFKNIADTLLATPRKGVVMHETRTRDSKMDVAHISSPSWEWFALTGDPYHLRVLQQVVNTTLIRNRTPERKSQGLDRIGLVPERHQPRSWGKALMLIWRAHELTPAGDWDWLLPKEYFAQSIADAGEQSQWIATLPDIRIMEMPRDFTTGYNQNSADAVDHMNMQALWTAGWMYYNGYEDYKELYEAMKAPLVKVFDLFGPGMVRAMPTLRQPWYAYLEDNIGRVVTFEDLRVLYDYWSHTDGSSVKYSKEERLKIQEKLGRSLTDEEQWRPEFVAFMAQHAEALGTSPVDLSSLPPNPFRTEPRRSLEVYHTIVFAEERFEGILASLIQLGDESLRPMHDRLIKARAAFEACDEIKRYGALDPGGLVCPTWDYGISKKKPDWSFETDMSALVKITFADAGPQPVAPAGPTLSIVSKTQTGVTIGLTDPNSGTAQETQTVLEIYDNSGLTGSPVLTATLAADTTSHAFASGLTAGTDYWATAIVSNSAGSATATTLPFTTDAASAGLTMPSVTGTPTVNATQSLAWTPTETFAIVFVLTDGRGTSSPLTALTSSDGSVTVTQESSTSNQVGADINDIETYSLSGLTPGVQITLAVTGGAASRTLIIPVPVAAAGAGVIAVSDTGSATANGADTALTINTTGSNQVLTLWCRAAGSAGTFTTDGSSVEIAGESSLASQSVTVRELEIPTGASITETITGTSTRRPTGVVVAIQDAP